MCVVLAHPGFWVTDPALGLQWAKLLHGEQSFTVERPIPTEGRARGEYEITAVEDKGADKGAVMHVAKRLFDADTGDLLATVASVYVLRGDGGHGGFGASLASPPPIPEGHPDAIIDVETLPQSALIYRLSGDLNPIHADPVAAREAGFPGPILHGLCSMGLATRGLVEAVGESDPAALRSVSLRFSKPVFPGETIRVEIFGTGLDVRFRARALRRDVVVLDRGSASFTRC